MNGVFNKYIWKCKVDISEFTEGDNHFVTLREPSTSETKDLVKYQNGLSKIDENNVDEVFAVIHGFTELSKVLIVDHDFYDGDKKLPSKDVAEFLDSKVRLAKAVMKEYMANLPLLQKSGEE